MHALEKVHVKIGRRIQGLPPNTSDPASHSTLGWQTIAGIFDIAKLGWVLRLLSLPPTSPYYQLAVRRFNSRRFYTGGTETVDGPFDAAYRVCQKYGFAGIVHDMMDTGELMSRYSWRRLCQAAVSEVRDRNWNMCRVLYPRLRFFNTAVTRVGCSVWWSVCRATPSCTKHCKNVVRLLTGECTLNSCRGRHMGGTRSSACSLCHTREEETVCHLVTTCPALDQIRQTSWQIVERVAPRAMLTSIAHMTLQQRTVFLMNGFDSEYVSEWQDLYESVAFFLSTLYSTRCSMNND